MSNQKCIAEIKDKNKSTWDKTVYRNCLNAAQWDGYCSTHHPKNISDKIEKEAFDEAIATLRDFQRLEEKAVGAFLRARNADVFNSALADIRVAAGLSGTYALIREQPADAATIFTPKKENRSE